MVKGLFIPGTVRFSVLVRLLKRMRSYFVLRGARDSGELNFVAGVVGVPISIVGRAAWGDHAERRVAIFKAASDSLTLSGDFQRIQRERVKGVEDPKAVGLDLRAGNPDAGWFFRLVGIGLVDETLECEVFGELESQGLFLRNGLFGLENLCAGFFDLGR